jgi:hypothetical protein
VTTRNKLSRRNKERQERIEHVFRAADDVVAGQHGAGEIDGLDRLE